MRVIAILTSLILPLAVLNSHAHAEVFATDMNQHWSQKYVHYLMNYGISFNYQTEYRGIVHGYPDGTFRPDKLITRAEAAQILGNLEFLTGTPEQNAKIVEERLSKFEDASTIPAWARENAAKISQHLITGYPDGTFRPINT